jgi:hypothetical protein
VNNRTDGDSMTDEDNKTLIEEMRSVKMLLILQAMATGCQQKHVAAAHVYGACESLKLCTLCTRGFCSLSQLRHRLPCRTKLFIAQATGELCSSPIPNRERIDHESTPQPPAGDGRAGAAGANAADGRAQPRPDGFAIGGGALRRRNRQDRRSWRRGPLPRPEMAGGRDCVPCRLDVFAPPSRRFARLGTRKPARSITRPSRVSTKSSARLGVGPRGYSSRRTQRPCAFASCE